MVDITVVMAAFADFHWGLKMKRKELDELGVLTEGRNPGINTLRKTGWNPSRAGTQTTVLFSRPAPPPAREYAASKLSGISVLSLFYRRIKSRQP